jgi:predicted transcriptional regulator
MPDTESRSDVTALTVQLLSAYLANNTVASDDLANLIRTTRSALTEDVNPAPAEPAQETYVPAVTARKSLASPEHVLSLIDGKPYKTLKRHLARHGLTPDSYRERYKLPSSYPMVAPSFAAKRREIAQKIGLGVRSKPRPGAPEQQNHAAAASDKSGTATTSRKNGAAKAETQKAASAARSRARAAVDKTAPATSSGPQAANDKPVAAKAAAASKKTAAVAEKDIMPAAEAKPGTSPSPKVQTTPSDKAKLKPGAVAARSKPAAGAAKRPARTKATDATNAPVIGEPRAKADPAATAQAGPARGAKLSLFRTKAGKTGGGDAVVPDAAPATPSEAIPARKAPKVKRMARMPAANSPQ